MAGKIYINDEIKSIIGGKIYIDGQIKTITHGKVYVNGQIKTISFVPPPPMPTVTQNQGDSVRFSSPSSFELTLHGFGLSTTWEYSKDNINWERVALSANGETSLQSSKFADGFAIYLRGIGNRTIANMATYKSTFHFANGSNISISGDTRNLFNYSNWSRISYYFNPTPLQYVFYNESAIKDASDFRVYVGNVDNFANTMFGYDAELIYGPSFTFQNTTMANSSVLAQCFTNCGKLKTRYEFSGITFSGGTALLSFMDGINIYSWSGTGHTKRYTIPNATGANGLFYFCKVDNYYVAPTSLGTYYVEDDCVII